MEPTASGIIPDLFAANAASLRRLARGLLADEGEAEDVFQETWLELLRHPPRRSQSLPGWLRAVLRNLARKRRRGEERRARREHAAARAEALEADPGDLVARVEVSHRLVSLVLELAEPERSAKALSTDARAALNARLLDLQRTFHDEVSRHLGEDLRAKLHDREPLIIRFEFGPEVSVMGRRRYF